MKEKERGKAWVLNHSLFEGEQHMRDVMVSDSEQASATISCHASIDLPFSYF